MSLEFIVASFPRLAPGLWLTIQLSLTSLAIAAVIGLSVGMLRAEFDPSRRQGRRSWLVGRPVIWAIDLYVFIVRGTPIIVQIYAAYFLLPLAGVKLPVFWVGIVALVFNSAGYQIEIARAAIRSVDAGQREGAFALGLRWSRVMRLVVLPQALPRMLPAFANEASNLIKASTVLSVIAIFELHKAANAIVSETFRFLEMLAAQAVLYLLFVVTLTQLARWLERRYSFDSGGARLTALR